MKEWFTLLTDRPEAEIESLIDLGQMHPMEAKKTLGAGHRPVLPRRRRRGRGRRELGQPVFERSRPGQIPEVAIPAAGGTRSGCSTFW